ncbi:MAG: GNAT family N-acetyltransferase [Gammaproteobacteria bacterium]|nr:GNAT family N-acetyltransferase [Gammaproteobacteria bacterium]
MFLTAKQVYLRPLVVADGEAFYQWSLDRSVTQYSLSSFSRPQSLTDHQKWLTNLSDNKNTVALGICCHQTDQLIGYAGIAGISQLNRCGEYFILIGDKQYWQRGIATEVTRLVTEYGFLTLGLHRIELTAFSVNIAAVKAYTKAGFQTEGIMRQAGYRNGQFLDKVMMAALATQYDAQPTDRD